MLSDFSLCKIKSVKMRITKIIRDTKSSSNDAKINDGNLKLAI